MNLIVMLEYQANSSTKYYSIEHFGKTKCVHPWLQIITNTVPASR